MQLVNPANPRVADSIRFHDLLTARSVAAPVAVHVAAASRASLTAWASLAAVEAAATAPAAHAGAAAGRRAGLAHTGVAHGVVGGAAAHHGPIAARAGAAVRTVAGVVTVPGFLLLNIQLLGVEHDGL